MAGNGAEQRRGEPLLQPPDLAMGRQPVAEMAEKKSHREIYAVAGHVEDDPEQDELCNDAAPFGVGELRQERDIEHARFRVHDICGDGLTEDPAQGIAMGIAVVSRHGAADRQDPDGEIDQIGGAQVAQSVIGELGSADDGGDSEGRIKKQMLKKFTQNF